MGRFDGDTERKDWGVGFAGGRVAMIASAAMSSVLKSWAGRNATISHWETSYSIAVSQLWERPRSITIL